MRTLRPLPAALAALAICGTGCGGGSTTTTSVPLPRSADTLERRQIDVVRRVSPSVVQIETSSGLGSGVVYDGKGHIVTNAHVVGGSRRFTVTLSEGDHHSATLVGAYAPQDLAVIRLDSGSPPAASLADSGKVEVGQFALAIGNPLGLRSSVTQGIISSLGRTVSEGNGVVISSAMQTSAPINPGNSGGALVDLAGAVVGIPTLAATDPELGGQQAPGIGFAIPSNTVRRIADQLIASGRVSRSGRALLGVEIATNQLARGVVVTKVSSGGPAARAGLRPGDVIVAIDGRPSPSADALATIVAEHRPGDRVKVTVIRADGSRHDITVQLGEVKG